MVKAVFLDRDGTLNEDPGYLSDPDAVHLFSGVGDALRLLHDAGYLLIVVSNQSGVGRGLFTVETLEKIHVRMNELLSPFSVQIDDFLACFHRPEDGCNCRKPKPKMLLEVAQAKEIDLSQSFMVGDKEIDLDTGIAAGVRSVALVRTGYGVETEKAIAGKKAAFIGNDLLEVSRWILSQ